MPLTPSPLPIRWGEGDFSFGRGYPGRRSFVACPGLVCGTPLAFSNWSLVTSAARRIDVATVQRIERLVGGDRVVEDRILRFIAARYGARSLLYLPPHVAAQVLKRPADFVRAAKRYCEPELGL